MGTPPASSEPDRLAAAASAPAQAASADRGSALAQGLSAAKANLIPAIILNVAAVLLAVSYAVSADFRASLSALSAVRMAHPWLYAITATAICGAIIPYFLTRLTKAKPVSLASLIFLIGLWAFKGAEVHILYGLQAQWFGTGNDWPTVIMKTVIDQGLYVPLWACPSLVLCYRFQALEFRWSAFIEEIHPRSFGTWYRQQVFPVLIMNACIWIPAVLCIYTLPTELQLPMQNVVLCLFVLLLAWITRTDHQADP